MNSSNLAIAPFSKEATANCTTVSLIVSAAALRADCGNNRKGGGKLPLVWKEIVPVTPFPSSEGRRSPATSMNIPRDSELMTPSPGSSLRLVSNPTELSLKMEGSCRPARFFPAGCVHICKSTLGWSSNVTNLRGIVCNRYTLLGKTSINDSSHIERASPFPSLSLNHCSMDSLLASVFFLFLERSVTSLVAAPNSIFPLSLSSWKYGPSLFSSSFRRAFCSGVCFVLGAAFRECLFVLILPVVGVCVLSVWIEPLTTKACAALCRTKVWRLQIATTHFNSSDELMRVTKLDILPSNITSPFFSRQRN
mmetsp:Transcript_5313/g.11715  ORF Transcript_5313/g.11715 Transcript_5313/m.11715 type:complete len:308 (-) Transcript_5313:41-964(-)